MAKKNLMQMVNITSLWILAIGGLNWGLVALFDLDLVTAIATALNYPVIGTLIKSLVGIAGVWIGILALQGKVTIKK